MRKFAYAAFVGGLLAMFGTSCMYLFSMMDALANGKDLLSVFVNTVIGGLLAWGFFTWLIYDVQKMFDDMNEAGRKERDEREQREQREAEEHNSQPRDNDRK
jgi:hypothetical protein